MDIRPLCLVRAACYSAELGPKSIFLSDSEVKAIQSIFLPFKVAPFRGTRSTRLLPASRNDEGSGNCYAKAFHTEGPDIADQVLEKVRKLEEVCERFGMHFWNPFCLFWLTFWIQVHLLHLTMISTSDIKPIRLDYGQSSTSYGFI